MCTCSSDSTGQCPVCGEKLASSESPYNDAGLPSARAGHVGLLQMMDVITRSVSRTIENMLSSLFEDKTSKSKQDTHIRTWRLLASPDNGFDDCDYRPTHIHYSSSLTLQAPQPPSAVSSQPQYVSPLMNTQAHFTSTVVKSHLSLLILLVVFKPSSPHLTLLSMYQVLKMPQMVCWKHCLFAQCEFSSPLSSSEVTKVGLHTTVTFCHHNIKGEWVISVRLAREV